ncbi:MAG: hypothetical protein ABWY06_23015 [Pseudomonas sp.]|uniref:hypothetical protein n=1 Tax=Pseudomonas sp. TaxID=306 RepID=UPI00339B7B14
MTQWTIAYTKDNNTSTLHLQAAQKPSLDQAVALLRAHAEREYEPLDATAQDNDLEGPAQELLQRFGITITGIAREE